MKYTPDTYRKATVAGVVATVGALGTATASGADPTDWTTYVGALGAGLIAFVGVFKTTNADHEPAPVPPSPSDQVQSGLDQAAQNKAASDSEWGRVTDIIGNVAGAAVGPLTQAAIDSVKLPRL